MSQLEINHLTKTFGDDGSETVAVDDINIQVADGEFLVLVGPSGCGKSTTLRCIAGLETVSAGDVVIDGETVTNRKPKNRDIAMVFQNYALYPHMTARENMAFGLEMTSDLSEDEISDRVEETAAMMGIEGLLDSTPGEVSGGQQQRIALGRAIVREPEVFLMDEPLSNLDAKLRTTMRTELQELQQQLGVTTVYVTHDQTEAMTMGDRIAVLNDGELQQIGTPLECYHSPANQFVAGFIGSPSMNFFDVEYDDGSLVHDEFTYRLSPDTVNSLSIADGRELTLGVRPSDIRPAEPDDENPVTITVNVTEPLGDATYVYFDVGDQTHTASIPANLQVSSNEEIPIAFPEERIHLFDGKSGEAIKGHEISTENQTEWKADI